MKSKCSWQLGAALAAALALFVLPAWAADLVAEKTSHPPQLDGKVDPLWSRVRATEIPTFAGTPGQVNITMKAMYDEEFVYLLVEWADKTMSLNRVYEFRGGQWKKRKGNEDRLSIMFNIGNSIAGFNQAGCQVVCHEGKYMATPNKEGRGDIWHWKSQRSNPVGYADDQWIQHTAQQKGHEVTGRKNDGKSGGGYSNNFDKEKNRPKSVGPGKGGPVILKASATTYAGGAVEGAIAPRELLAKPKGSRGDIDVAGVWKNGKWTLELRRKLNTGHPDDVVFIPGEKHAFGVAVHENGDDLHHSYSVGASQLILKSMKAN